MWRESEAEQRMFHRAATRRQKFEERNAVVMKSKLRTIGIDKDALDRQVQEKLVSLYSFLFSFFF